MYKIYCWCTILEQNAITVTITYNVTQACSKRHHQKYPVNAQRAFDSVMFIARHTKEAADIQVSVVIVCSIHLHSGSLILH